MAENKTLKLPLRKWIAIHGALSQLDGFTEVSSNDKGETRRKTTAYKLSGKVRKAIIRDLAKIQPHIDEFNKARDGKLVELSGGTGSLTPETDGYEEKLLALQKDTQELLDDETEISELSLISIDDLNLDENALMPNTIVAALDVLLTE